MAWKWGPSMLLLPLKGGSLDWPLLQALLANLFQVIKITPCIVQIKSVGCCWKQYKLIRFSGKVNKPRLQACSTLKVA